MRSKVEVRPEIKKGGEETSLISERESVRFTGRLIGSRKGEETFYMDPGVDVARTNVLNGRLIVTV